MRPAKKHISHETDVYPAPDSRKVESRRYSRLLGRCGAVAPLLIIIGLFSAMMLDESYDNTPLPRPGLGSSEQRSYLRFREVLRVTLALLRGCRIPIKGIRVFLLSLTVLCGIGLALIVFLLWRRSPSRPPA
jgi:hypothetical protein